MSYYQPQTRKVLPAACDAIGLPTAPDDPALSKAGYLESRLVQLSPEAAPTVADRLLEIEGTRLRTAQRFELEEARWKMHRSVSIPKKFRHDLARALDGVPLFLHADRFMKALQELWIIETPFNALVAAFAGGTDSLKAQIEQHVVRNEGDWPTEYFFERLGAFEASDQRFARFLEALASSDVRPDEKSQRGSSLL